MARIDINEINVLSTKKDDTSKGYEFIPIGNAAKIFGDGGKLDRIRNRIFRQNRATVEDFWATLGRQDGNKINWKGYLLCSSSGSDSSLGVVSDEIALLKEMYPDVGTAGKRALEKYIDFDNVRFDDNDPGSRKLRLTVMTDEGMGALVFYQHTTKDDKQSSMGFVEYIQPEYFEDGDDKRDRYDYFFDVPENLQSDDRFIIKIITFNREKVLSDSLLRKFDKPYRLLRYNATSNAFDQVSNFDADTRSKKTLFIIHGTFSTTENSYKGAIESGWFRKLISDGMYEQVLGFDHPTVIDDAVSNMNKLVEMAGAGNKFTQPVDIITTSRGGLVGKTIVNSAAIQQNLFTVRRMVPVACANGVEYFTFGREKVLKFLSVLRFLFKASGRTGAATIVAIAQTSAKIFLAQPGCQLMTPGSDRLKAVLDGKPANTALRYFPITGDVKPGTGKEKLIEKLVSVVYKSNPNDWVVGTQQQAIMPEGFYAYKNTRGWDYNHYLTSTYNSVHTRYTYDPNVLSSIRTYLADSDANIQ